MNLEFLKKYRRFSFDKASATSALFSSWLFVIMGTVFALALLQIGTHFTQSLDRVERANELLSFLSIKAKKSRTFMEKKASFFENLDRENNDSLCARDFLKNYEEVFSEILAHPLVGDKTTLSRQTKFLGASSLEFQEEEVACGEFLQKKYTQKMPVLINDKELISYLQEIEGKSDDLRSLLFFDNFHIEKKKIFPHFELYEATCSLIDRRKN